MNIYLLELERKSTSSILRVHIEAHNMSLAHCGSKHLYSQFDIVTTILCNHPFGKHRRYRGARIWKMNNGYRILLPGNYNCISTCEMPFRKLLSQLEEMLECIV